jgi:hypothetical protein
MNLKIKSIPFPSLSFQQIKRKRKRFLMPLPPSLAPSTMKKSF